MADIVSIVAGISYSTRASYIHVIDSNIAFPGLVVGARPAPVVASMIDAGFTLIEYGGNGNVTNYLLTRQSVVPPTCSPLEPFEGRLNTTVTVTTAAGTETGTLLYVGEDYVQLLESNGDVLLIPAYSIESVI
ncbi:hypothetical protein [Cohnella thailandensis]|uniref:Uncharacterized protein n=1 Tax=Cohnella thailandensis TaxID=557557 RepID=A0A841T3H3_9BACL|nr:hypothetical protein [Cohnella thailandensis]MBB6635661.1 hypothetical protein [Cohnella thailandensis]MBP1976038.1 hypothetical protein [Cohnella thailandensis]